MNHRKSLMASGALVAVLAGCLAGTSAANAAPEPMKGSISASSYERADLAATAAVDGKTTTRWSSKFADPQWLQVDLGKATKISKVVLNWEAAFASAFTIQTSDGGGLWDDATPVTRGVRGLQTLDVTATARYVRLHATKRATQYGVSLWEFEVYGTGSGPVASPSATPKPSQTPTTQPTVQPGGDLPVGPVPAGAVRVAEFVAECPFSHRLPDDPIVMPGLAGGSHMHSFMGSEITDANTNLGDLLTGTSTCEPKVDLSSYWVPTLYNGDTPVEPSSATFYYLGEGVSEALQRQTRAFPQGLRVVAGNAKATAADGTSSARWSCLHAGHVGASKNFVNCPAGTKLETYLDFPHCWDGRNLDSADHKSHLSYPQGNACPTTHPVVVPKVRMVLRYPVNGDPSAFRLSSGPGYTMHGDFFNAWPVAEMERRVRDCIRPKVKCGPDGTA
ncbi:DUF1996 domain-containing protein [Herbidospora mongoliensis]|uniref:DUF1996 domain-containing protein n=1 Tax=Herbidospora mongoliensis TaxID=688067 RepID=UPI000836E206|nr:DUF1996 domain-containing protein [Herbidospora mongoliensis]